MVPKILIVIPNRSKFVTAWCYENAFRLISEGNRVEILDLAKYDLRYFGNNLYWFYDNNLLEKNDIRKAVVRDLKKVGVVFLKPNEILTDLNATTLKESDVFYFNAMIRSAYAWHYGSSKFEQDLLSKKLLDRERKNFAFILNNLRVFLKNKVYDRLYTINGRTQIDSCVVRCAQELNIEYSLIEKTSYNWNYYSVHRKAPQDIDELAEKISMNYKLMQKNHSQFELDEIAEKYFAVRLGGFSENPWENLHTHKLETNLDYSEHAVFYTGSDYEFAIEDSIAHGKMSFTDESNFFQQANNSLNQVHAFKTLLHECRKLQMKLLVRIHPHPKESHLHETDGKLWEQICLENGVDFISSDDETDSIEIAKQAKVNIVFRSSIAIKIAFLKLPCIILGKTEFNSLVPTLCVSSKDDLVKLLRKPQIVNPSSITPWALYMAFGEVKIKYFEFFSEQKILYRELEINKKTKFGTILSNFILRFKPKISLFKQ